MKKFVLSVLAFPATLVGSWLATGLVRRFEDALADIDFELGLDDA